MGIFPIIEYSYHFNRFGTYDKHVSIFVGFSILGNSLRNSKICCFQIHFVNFYRRLQMAAIMLQTIPNFYTKNSEKSLFISANTYEKNIVCTDYCIAHHDDKTCPLPACKYHIILLGNVEELLQKLDTFSFTHKHVDCLTYKQVNCLYTLFKYRFSGKVIAKSGQVFDNVQRAVDFNHRNKGVDRMPSIAKKRPLRKKFREHLFSSFENTKTTQTSGSVFAERMEKVKKTKFELELIKIVDCFLDGHGNYDSSLVSFRIKSL